MREKRPIPYGFSERATEINSILMQEFHCSGEQIKRWRLELGLPTDERTCPKQICQTTLQGAYVATHKSIHSAARKVNGSASNIWKCAKGKIPTAYGFEWRYNYDRT